MTKDKNEEKITSKATLPLDQLDEIGCMFVVMLFPCLPLSVLEIQGNRMSKFHGRPLFTPYLLKYGYVQDDHDERSE